MEDPSQRCHKNDLRINLSKWQLMCDFTSKRLPGTEIHMLDMVEIRKTGYAGDVHADLCDSFIQAGPDGAPR